LQQLLPYSKFNIAGQAMLELFDIGIRYISLLVSCFDLATTTDFEKQLLFLLFSKRT
jgi:hypothetical protein